MSSTVVTIILSVFASSGFWAFLQFVMSKKDAKTEMLIGLGHNEIVKQCNIYIEKGYISADEYENLYEYLYKPYDKLGGNGSAKRIMEKVKALPIKN